MQAASRNACARSGPEELNRREWSLYFSGDQINKGMYNTDMPLIPPLILEGEREFSDDLIVRYFHTQVPGSTTIQVSIPSRLADLLSDALRDVIYPAFFEGANVVKSMWFGIAGMHKQLDHLNDVEAAERFLDSLRARVNERFFSCRMPADHWIDS